MKMINALISSDHLSTCSTQGNVSGEEIIKYMEEAKKLLDNMPPRCVILFNDQMKKDAIVQGESVDEMLGCENNEKGFIVSDLNREDVMKFGGNAVRIVNNPNPFLLKWKDIKIEVREPNRGNKP